MRKVRDPLTPFGSLGRGEGAVLYEDLDELELDEVGLYDVGVETTLLPCLPISFELPELLGVEGLGPCRLLDPKLVPLLTEDVELLAAPLAGIPKGLLVRLLLALLLPLLVIGGSLSILVRMFLSRDRAAARS